MSTPFTPGELTGPQARALNELARVTEQFSRLTVAAPLSLTRPAGIPAIRIDLPDTTSTTLESAFIYGNGTVMNLASGTPTDFTFGASIDTGGFWNVANPTRLVFPEAGSYLVGANVFFAGPLPYAAEVQLCYLARSNQVMCSQSFTLPSGVACPAICLSARIIGAILNDYLTVKITQYSGGVRSVGNITIADTFAWMYKM